MHNNKHTSIGRFGSTQLIRVSWWPPLGRKYCKATGLKYGSQETGAYLSLTLRRHRGPHGMDRRSLDVCVRALSEAPTEILELRHSKDSRVMADVSRPPVMLTQTQNASIFHPKHRLVEGVVGERHRQDHFSTGGQGALP